MFMADKAGKLDLMVKLPRHKTIVTTKK